MCQSLVIGHDSLCCDKWRKYSNDYHDVDLDHTMPNVKLIQANIIQNNILKFRVPTFKSFRVIILTHTHTHTCTHTHARMHEHTHTHMH